MKEHPHPTTSTVKQLYANAFRCAFPGCKEPLYREDKASGTWLLNSRICHINARSEGGPRWDSSQAADDNRSEGNLVLMCLPHATQIDDRRTLDAYPAPDLLQWKAAQVAEHRNIAAGWQLTEQMAVQAAEASFSHVGVAINNSTLHLGGEGGRGPGAGGGGGGAVGAGARAGRGGNGGRIIDDDGYPLMGDELESFARAMPGDPSRPPGSGGGGAPGVDGIGGDGGDGGDGWQGTITGLEPGAVFSVEIGEAGSAPHLPGQHGAPGGDTVITITAADGTVKRVIRARGGEGAKAGALPEDWQVISNEDLSNGFQISTLILANAIESRDGLFFVLGAGWSEFFAPILPFDAIWPVLCVATWRSLSLGSIRGVQICLSDPSGIEVSRVAFSIPAEACNGTRFAWQGPIGAPLGKVGTWRISAHSGNLLLSEISVAVKLVS